MCILLHKRKFNCFPHKSGSSHLSPTQTGRGKQLRFSPNILLISKHKRFPKKEMIHDLWVTQSINWVLNTKNLKLVFLQKKVYLHTKEKIHHCCNIYTNTLCLQIFVVSGFAQPYHTIPYYTCIYSYSQTPFIHSHIKSNSNSGFSNSSNSSSTVNSAVKPQFGLQHSFKFALFCNTTDGRKLCVTKQYKQENTIKIRYNLTVCSSCATNIFQAS